MKRREFIGLSATVAGGLMIGRNCLFADALREVSGNLQATTAEEGYDVVVKGAGILGVFAALSAAKRGLKALIVDKRPNPAFEMASKFNLSLKSEGLKQWDAALAEMFFPNGEKEEINNPKLGGLYSSEFGGNALFMAGSVKKSFMRAIALGGVDALFMTDVFGVASDESGSVTGAALASKQGTFFVKCSSFIDADDCNFFSRKLSGSPYKIASASFTFECCSKTPPLNVAPFDACGVGNLRAFQGKIGEDQFFASFDIFPESPELSKIERMARSSACELVKNRSSLPAGFGGLSMRYWACECSFNAEGAVGAPKLENYFVLENCNRIKSCADISEARSEAVKIAEGLSPKGGRQKSSVLHFAGGRAGISVGAPVVESGMHLPLFHFDASGMKLPEAETDVLVAGVGTAGMFALDSAARRGAKTFGIEYFNEVGGTKIVGGVGGYYWGLKNHPYLRKYEREISGMMADGFFHLGARTLSSAGLVNNSEVVFGAIICGASLSGDRLESVLACADSELFRVKAKVTVDCTGDADIAAFAGVPFAKGDARAGLTINHSQWDRVAPRSADKKRSDIINKDYGLSDISKISEFQRSLFLSHYEARYYDFYPMLTPRELRRPEGAHVLTLKEAVESRAFPDTVAQSYSDYDPHSYPTGKFSRCAMMLPHWSNRHVVNIPYGSLIPKGMDGLLFGGRGISATHDAYQFTRMSADVSLLGIAEGIIAADCAKSGGGTRSFDVSGIVEEWKKGAHYTADFGKRVLPSDEELVARLGRADETALFEACLRPPDIMLPRLAEAFSATPTLPIAQALSFFGDARGVPVILRSLSKNFAAEKKNPQPSDFLELYTRGNLSSAYWKINRDIAFLALSGSDKSDEAVASVLKHAKSGGPRVSGPNAYTANRIDLSLIPNYNRIGNLCFYAERRPNARFARDFERLLDDENIAGGRTGDYSKARWNAYRGILEMLLSSAAARCGSLKGAERLAGYLTDVHSDFRDFARRDLSDICGEDFGYDAQAYLKAAKRFAGSARSALSKIYAESY